MTTGAPARPDTTRASDKRQRAPTGSDASFSSNSQSADAFERRVQHGMTLGSAIVTAATNAADLIAVRGVPSADARALKSVDFEMQGGVAIRN